MNHASAIEFYRRLLRLYPPAFRREFGDEMAGVFADALEEAAGRGPCAVLRCVAREAAHAPKLLLRAHLDEQRLGLAYGAAHGALRQEASMSRRSQVIMYGLAALPLAIVGWWFSIIQGGAAVSLSTVAFVAAGGLVVPALAWVTRRLNPWLWAAVGLAALATLAVPALRPYMYGESSADGSGMMPGQLWWLPAAALVLTALLLGSGLHAATSRRQRGVLLAMAGLLLAAALHALYWQLTWDSQIDPRDWFWVMLPVLAAVTMAAVLLATLAGQRWPPAVHRTLMIALALLAPLLLFSVPAVLTFSMAMMEETPRVNHAALADLNGDGHLDAFLAVGNGNMPFPAYALYNDGTGRFDVGAQPIGKWPGYAVALGDVNGDGLADALLDISAGGLILYLNNGGAFRHYGGLAESGPKGVMRLVPVISDLNGDGRMDVFAAGCCGRPPGESPETVANAYQPPYSRVWLQTAEGRLRAGQQVGDAPSHAAALADLDGDGDLDVFLANGRPLGEDWKSGPPQPNTVWLNDGQGNFHDSGQRLGQAESRAVALGDVNGDGWPDAVVGNYGADEVWLNDGQGNFTDSGQHLGGGATLQVYAADLDGDRDLDLFLAGAIEGQAWLNDGSGQFTPSAQVLRYATDTAVVVGDVTGDGWADVLAAGPRAYHVWVNDSTGRFIDGPRGDYR